MAAHKKDWGHGGASAPLISATAAVNGLGFNSHQTWAFWRAEVTPFAETPFRLDNGERATMAHVRSLEPKSVGVERLSTLTKEALDQLGPTLRGMPFDASLSAKLCVSERFDDLSDPYFGRQRARLEEEFHRWFEGNRIDAQTELVAKGHAGFAYALREGCAALMDRQIDLLVLGGVESYYDPLVIDILMEQERIFDQVRTDAFIPGEGAAFVLVTRRSMARQCALSSVATIETVSTAEEPGVMLSDDICTGLGLTSAMRGCIDRLRDANRKLEWFIGDITNEPYRAYEFQLAFPRAIAPGGLDTGGETYREVAVDDLQSHLLPSEFGDLGAATMPTALVIASEAFLRGRPQANNCLIFSSSVTAERGAVLISPPIDRG